MLKTIFKMMALRGSINGTRVSPSYIPDSIMKKFTVRYGLDTTPIWNFKFLTYQAILKDKNTFIIANYNFWGNLTKEVVEFGLNKSPFGITAKLQDNYAGYLLKKTYRVEENKVRNYQVEMRKGLEIIRLIFKPDGTLISIEKRAIVI